MFRFRCHSFTVLETCIMMHPIYIFLCMMRCDGKVQLYATVSSDKLKKFNADFERKKNPPVFIKLLGQSSNLKEDKDDTHQYVIKISLCTKYSMCSFHNIFRRNDDAAATICL